MSDTASSQKQSPQQQSVARAVANAACQYLPRNSQRLLDISRQLGMDTHALAQRLEQFVQQGTEQPITEARAEEARSLYSAVCQAIDDFCQQQFTARGINPDYPRRASAHDGLSWLVKQTTPAYSA